MLVRLEYLGVEVSLSVHLQDASILNQGLGPKEGHLPADLEKSEAFHLAHSL